MISTTLTLMLCFSIGLVVYFVSNGEFYDAFKALVGGIVIFAMLAGCLAVRREARRVGY